MTPRLDILFDFLECDGGSVQLGDNMECKIVGIGKVRIQLRDGSSFVLHDEYEGIIAYTLWMAMQWRVWVHILRSKHEAFGKFKEWKQIVENQTRRMVKKLGTYNGADNSVEELQVERELQRLNNHTLKEDQTDQEDGDDEDIGDQETDQTPDLTDYQLAQDREPRIRTKPLRFRDEIACEVNFKWKAAIKEEMDSLRKNKTWELVDHLAGQKLVSCKWLFRIKEGIGGVQKPMYKARLVARGFTQGVGIDYNEVFSSVVRHTSIRVILALTACKDYELEQLDVKKTFLHGNLKEVICMRRFDEYMLSNGFKRSSYDSCVYYKSYAPGVYIYLILYVDDMLIACKSKAEIGSTKSLLKKEFNMKELGETKKILSMEIIRDRSRKIMRDCPVRDFDVERMNKVSYANAVGSLMFLMVCTRPYIVYAVSVVSKYLVNSGKNHWKVVKWILKYLRGTTNVGLVYGTNRGNHVDVTGFVDSDYAKDPDKGRSVTGYAFLVQGCVVSWKAMLQHVVALSTIEAEYMALTEAVKEAIWLRGLLEELGVELNTVAVNCDNQGAIHLSRNHVFMRGLSTSMCVITLLERSWKQRRLKF
ncbi:retrovirus-related pol polyprotein from transposon TNT 1-94 [Tanacetum coccineum]